MSIFDRILGRPLASSAERSEQVGVPDGVCVFGLDALGSAAYGPEAALTLLIPLGLAGLHYIVPLTATIVVLLLLVYFSYLQTIDAYPNGGGSYTVAGENLGKGAGVVAGAALLLDYMLNVSVGISTGVGALVSAVPALQRWTLALCVCVLAVLVVTNLRGVRESGVLWRLPTLVFVLCLLAVLGVGLYKMGAHGGHPVSMDRIPKPIAPPAAAGLWLLLRAFASGCTALTGVEAVSNGVSSFKEPKQRTAKWTLTAIVAILGVLVMGVAVLVRAYGITATDPGKAGYQSILSMTTAAVVGRGVFYYVTIASILAVLSLSANTSFAGFPRVCKMMADDGYLPRVFALSGRRLVYTTGVVVLAVLSGGLLLVFGGVTDRLIPLFAIGAFLAFTFSQLGMVQHWRKSKSPHAGLHVAVNAVGALATGTATVIIFLAKFRSGAWITVCTLVPLVLVMRAVHRHYEAAEAERRLTTFELAPNPGRTLFLVPIERWDRASVAAVRFVCGLDGEVQVLHVQCDENDCTDIAKWRSMLDEAASRGGIAAPQVVELHSEFRAITRPILKYVLHAVSEQPGRSVAVVFPQLVAARWYLQVLHNYRATLLKMRLAFAGRRRVAIVDVPWQLSASAPAVPGR